MTSLRVEWRPIAEPIWDEVYVASPRNAALYVFPGSLWRAGQIERHLDAIGCFEHERVTVLDEYVYGEDRIPPYVPIAPFRRHLRRLNLLGLAGCARLVGLRRLLSRLVRHASQTGDSVAEVLRDVKSAEGRAHGTHCLPRALARWSRLARAGFRPTLVLGIAVPAARMHAWVTVNGRHVGEDPDEVAGYQSAVSFTAVGGCSD